MLGEIDFDVMSVTLLLRCFARSGQRTLRIEWVAARPPMGKTSEPPALDDGDEPPERKLCRLPRLI
jgi:hypothetical protein